MESMLLVDENPELLYTGAAWTEGPVWLPRSRSVRFSDIPNSRILDYSTDTGETVVHSQPAEWTNGRTLDLHGRVVECSHGLRAVQREDDEGVTTLVDRWEGGRFNSPNDVVVDSRGVIWFTDPPYGLKPDGREGRPGEQDYDGCFVFRFDPASGDIDAVITDMVYPNGLAFSADERLLYVADTGDGREDGIRVYEVDAATGATTNGRRFIDAASAHVDGLRVDRLGRLWVSAGEGIEVLAPDGERLLRVELPERVSNLCFGGEDGTELFVTASSSLWRLRTTTRSATGR
jgi:gluconolactonase